MGTICAFLLFLSIGLFQPSPAFSQDFKRWEAQKAKDGRWLDSVGPNGAKYWVKLDGRQRPHRLYVGEGFFRASHRDQELFVETYSHYLAGHPEKYMLIDLFDAATDKLVGEFGWGGFRLLCGPNGSKAKC